MAEYDEATDTTTVANHITYDAFGNVISESAAVDHLFGYTGRAYDEETGLQNNLNRWYDSANGKWLSNDPIGFQAGDANLYRYVGNGPTLATDPSGLAADKGKVSQEIRNAVQQFVDEDVPLPEGFLDDAANRKYVEGFEKDVDNLFEKNAKKLAGETNERQRGILQRSVNRQANRSLRLKRLLGKVTKRLPVIGAVITAATFADRCAEAGAGRAALEATPLLGDLVMITEDFQQAQAILKDTADAHERAAHVPNISARNAARVSQKQTRDTYARLAGKVRVNNYQSVDRNRLVNDIGDAAGRHTTRVLNARSGFINGQMNRQQFDNRINQADMQLQTDLDSAVRNSGGGTSVSPSLPTI